MCVDGETGEGGGEEEERDCDAVRRDKPRLAMGWRRRRGGLKTRATRLGLAVAALVLLLAALPMPATGGGATQKRRATDEPTASGEAEAAAQRSGSPTTAARLQRTAQTAAGSASPKSARFTCGTSQVRTGHPKCPCTLPRRSNRQRVQAMIGDASAVLSSPPLPLPSPLLPLYPIPTPHVRSTSCIIMLAINRRQRTCGRCREHGNATALVQFLLLVVRRQWQPIHQVQRDAEHIDAPPRLWRYPWGLARCASALRSTLSHRSVASPQQPRMLPGSPTICSLPSLPTCSAP